MPTSVFIRLSVYNQENLQLEKWR